MSSNCVRGPATEQEDQRATFFRQINPQPRPPIDNALADPSKPFQPARIPFLDPRERGSDLRCRRRVKRLEPTTERARSVGPYVLDYAHDGTAIVTDTLPSIKGPSSTRRGWATGGMTNLSRERSRCCNKTQPDQVPTARRKPIGFPGFRAEVRPGTFQHKG